MDVADYYDQMHAYTLRDADFDRFSGFRHDAIHRFLVDTETGEFSPKTIYRVIAPFLPRRDDFRGLDAGCGYGATGFFLHGLTGGHWHGVTISAAQVEVASARAEAQGMAGQVDFSLLSYDQPLGGPYDTIVAIESLAHSLDTRTSLANLVRHLRPGGRIVVVDDMPLAALMPEESAMLARFQRLWRVPGLRPVSFWREAFAAEGLDLLHEAELLPLTRPREESALDEAWALLEAALPEKRRAGYGAMAEGELGGILLERLMRMQAVGYGMLVAEKRG